MQVAVDPELTLLGLQLNVASAGVTTDTTPPVALVGIGWPAADAPSVPPRPTVAKLAVMETVMLMVAMTPFWMILLFSPLKKQV